MLDAVRDAIEHWRNHPRDLVEDLLGATAIVFLTVGLLFVPLILG